MSLPNNIHRQVYSEQPSLALENKILRDRCKLLEEANSHLNHNNIHHQVYGEQLLALEVENKRLQGRCELLEGANSSLKKRCGELENRIAPLLQKDILAGERRQKRTYDEIATIGLKDY